MKSSYVVWKFIEVALIHKGKKDGGRSCSLGGQRLLLDPTHRQDLREINTFLLNVTITFKNICIIMNICAGTYFMYVPNTRIHIQASHTVRKNKNCTEEC